MSSLLGPLGRGIEELLKEGKSRFFTPGHKGEPIFPVGEGARWDFSEVAGSDSLYEAEGIIAQSEAELSQLYSCTTLISAGGSTLGVQAMLTLGIGLNKSLLLSRNCHVSALNTMGLLNIQPVWLPSQVDKESGLEKTITGQDIHTALTQHPEISGVYITSPDYYGRLAPIKEISRVCKEFKVPLLVDCAHGAHLKFTPRDLFPISQGADLCCTSLHKTLPVLTGGALLHLGDNWSREEGKKALSIYGSTSPSYLTMLSVDSLIPYLQGEGQLEIKALEEKVEAFIKKVEACGYKQLSQDPFRLTLDFRNYGYTKQEFLAFLDQLSIEPEYLDNRFVVFLIGLQQPLKDWQRLEGLLDLPKRTGLRNKQFIYPKLQQVISLREALFAASFQVPLSEAAGKIAGNIIAPCPPGIPLVVPGEKVTKELVEILAHHGVSQINVL